MRFKAVQKSLVESKCDVLILSLFEGAKPARGTALGLVDKALGGAIKKQIEKEGFEAKIGQTTELGPCSGVAATKIVVAGLGKKEEFDSDKVRRASAAAAKRAKDLKAKTILTTLHGDEVGGIDAATSARALVEGAILGTYQFLKHKTEDLKPNTIETVEITDLGPGKVRKAKAGINRGQAMAEAINFARDLTNEPASVVTPTYFAERAEAVAGETGLECRVIGREEMQQLGMNMLLAVAKGSIQEPKFVVMRYKAPNARKTVALVGKGITFDSGGLNLKGGGGLEWMKDDMSGAGVVLASMRAVAQLKPKVNVLGLMPLTENMPGGNATHPGDIVRALSGKTVEINNTDAEGRLILGDAVAFAEREKANEIIDIATLTGSVVTALGRSIAGILGSDQGLVDRLIQAGEQAGEKLWQLPLFQDYEEATKSEFADMSNVGGDGAGTIMGAWFIKKHIEKTPWAHIDIAGTCTRESGTPLGPKGGTGFGVGTLVGYVMSS